MNNSQVQAQAIIDHRNGSLWKQFDQSSTGFGVSNFRNEQIPSSVNRLTTDFQLENVHQFTNPITDFEMKRHSNFLFNEHYKDYHIIDQQELPDDYIYLDIIKTIHERNAIIDIFFSKRNLDHLQKLIIAMVKHQSEGQYNISRQSDQELLTVMRSIYITTPCNPFGDQTSLRNDICNMNKNVLDWVVPRILVKVQQYLGYVRDQSNNAMPHKRPEFMSGTGNRINRGFDVTFV